MLSFFAELVTRTDEDRRAFETHPVLIDAVARRHAVERYRALLLELYHVVWHFNPVCAAAASRMGDASCRCATSSTSTCTRRAGTRSGSCNDLEAVGVRARGGARPRAGGAHAGAQRLQLLGRRPPPPLLGAGHAVCAGGHRLGLRRAVRFGDPRVAAARRRPRRVLHRFARHAGRPAHGRAAPDPEHAAQRRRRWRPSSNRRA